MSLISYQQTWLQGTKNVIAVPEAGSWGWGGSRADGPSEQNKVPSRPDPVTVITKEWPHECECVCWNFIRPNTTNTWNCWHTDGGLGILWHKNFKCNGISFHRTWLFSGESTAARQKEVKECHQSFQKSFRGSDEVAGKFNPRKFNPLSNTRKSVIAGPIRLNPGNVGVSCHKASRSGTARPTRHTRHLATEWDEWLMFVFRLVKSRK